MLPFDAHAAIATLPDTIVVDGLERAVRIRRDGAGIPHVEAASEADLWFGQGFATAQDRLWQLEWDRRRADGRSAELFGSPANAVTDAFNRRVRLAEHARRGYAALDDEARAMCDAHAAGIDAFCTSTAARPVEFQALGVPDEPWEGWHAVAVFLVRHVTFATWQTKLWNARVLAALGPDAVARFRSEGTAGTTPLIVPPGARAAVGALVDAGLFAGDVAAEVAASLRPLGLQLSGSNAWAVHGSRTASGAPMIAGDPHRTFEVPNVYYQVRLTCPSFDAAGFSFPGVPGVPHFGQTDHVAWAVTNAMADYQDLYVERLPGAVVDRRVETVRVRDGADVSVKCLTTRHGPIVLGDSEHGVGVALASSGLVEPGGSLRTIVPMLRARTVADLDALLAEWVEPANNFVLADTAGHIAYRTSGRIPLRHALNAVLPVPGWDEAYDWTGHIPDAELPRAHDPVTGAVVTANQRVTTRDYPYLLNDDAAPPHRAERIWARLGERTRLTVEDLAAIHGDTVSLPGRELAKLIAATDTYAAAILRGWEGDFDVDSRAGALVGLVRHELAKLVASAFPAALRTNPFAAWEPPATALPPEVRVTNALAGWLAADDTTITGAKPWLSLVSVATERAIDELRRRFGANATAWRWGALHEATPLHALHGIDDALDALVRPRSGPVSGGADCVMAMNQHGGVTTDALTGSTARYVWDLGDRRRSAWTVPLGASGHPASAHFRDQTATWAVAALRPVDDGTTTSAVELRPAL